MLSHLRFRCWNKAYEIAKNKHYARAQSNPINLNLREPDHIQPN